MPLDIEDNELHQIRDAFKTFDKDGNSRIEIDELENVYHALGRDFTQEDLKEMINAVDLNNDGYITFHEFLNLYKKKVIFDANEEKLRQAFKICDCDDNGYVTIDELRRIMIEVGENLTHEQIKSIVKEVDLDGDDKINFEEFIRLMKNQHFNT
ncbi:MAG: hypothetical protein EU539_03935 [Promethearchaeota archaeon]|nr:MAG: hypothetical protein EU539_03935 [Candidatus Lokiarchaeota archaeon]